MTEQTEPTQASGYAAAVTGSASAPANTDHTDSQREAKIQASLFGEILDWMLVPLLLLWPISIAITYLVAKSTANQPFDHALEDRVTVLAQQLKFNHEQLVAPLPSMAADILRADSSDQLVYAVNGPHAELLDGDSGLPIPASEDTHQAWTVLFRDDQYRSNDVRVAYLYLPQGSGQDLEPDKWIVVQVAETLEKRALLSNQIVKGVIVPEFVILPLALVLIWFALTRGLAPLTDLQRRIRNRRSDDLSPIESGLVPEEISPLVASLNEMLGRLSHTIHLQKRFIADAAHQMKTPLAGMRMQSELALRQHDKAEINHSLEQLAKSSESATRLVNQLLALARAEDVSPTASAFVPMDLSELAREATLEWFTKAQLRSIDLGLEQPGRSVMVQGNPIMLRELINNLIDNALRYSPTGASVTVRVKIDREQRLAQLEVEDNGPGIPASERHHVFERFYRILGTEVEGSGLGLSIVREIASQHDGEVDIFSNPRCTDLKMPGCLVRVSLRLLPSPGAMDDLG